MLQINLQPFASDALEDAMRLAQTKALNSYSFSDQLNFLNYAWMDIYQKIAQLDEGYYSKTVRLTQKLTKLPPYVKNTIRIYAAHAMLDSNRLIYKASGYSDLRSHATYHISGFDLYCPDAELRTVWLNYVPMQPMIFFTAHNRDPRICEEAEKIESTGYGMYVLVITEIDGGTKYELVHRTEVDVTIDITEYLIREGYEITYLSCDYPYIFVSYKNKADSFVDYVSGFFKDMVNNPEWIEYNPFAFTGRPSNVEYVQTKWNDKTGMGVIVKDYNDQERLKELGWTPDTLLIYPAPEVYRYLVALLADKFAALNESEVMGVSKELVEAKYAFMNFLKKDKSAWQRLDNVLPVNITDYL
jgi:hypothetical protein